MVACNDITTPLTPTILEDGIKGGHLHPGRSVGDASW